MIFSKITSYLLLRLSAWLDVRGLSSVASILEERAARQGNAVAVHALAKRQLANNQTQLAIQTLLEATQRTPNDASLWCTLGAAHRHALAFDDALVAYEKAVALDSKMVRAWSNLGEWHLAKGSASIALEKLQQALAIQPDFFEARVNRVAVLFELGSYEEARVEAQALVEQSPHRPEPYVNLGNVLVHTGKAKQAVQQYRKALEINPDYVEAHYNLATLLGSQDDLKNAIAYLEKQIEVRGETIHQLCMLASAHQAAGHLSKAEKICREVMERQPLNLSAHVTLASCVSNAGDAQAAYALYERINTLPGNQGSLGSNLLFEMNYLPAFTRAQVFQKHLDWAHQYAPSPTTPVSFSEHDRSPARKLKIGYVSGDFCSHPVGFLLRDILNRYDKTRFEVHCFSMVIRGDAVTDAIRQSVDHWDDIFLVNDADLVQLVRDAHIDILVDLSGHTAFHRLIAFAQRMAPVQVSWIGYFHSTGMPAMDYFITDPHTSPRHSGQLFSEAALHLPHTRFCFSPPSYAAPVSAPPFDTQGHITFGSFNRLAKLNARVIAVWSRILQAVPQSKLLIKAGAMADTVVQARIEGLFAENGIAKDRLELRAGSGHGDMLAEYADMDIALDAFPFNGGMTTLEALWMGVPLVSLAGDTVVARQTYSALANMGLADTLCCATEDVYVEKAVALAQAPAQLRDMRAHMRQRMADSPLCQPDAFTRDLENLYSRMWQAWCEGKKLPTDVLTNTTEPAAELSVALSKQPYTAPPSAVGLVEQQAVVSEPC